MQRDYRKWKDQRRLEGAADAFFSKWYGDGCPSWIWPLTAFLVGCGVVFGAWLF
jgi:hypothetical protein